MRKRFRSIGKAPFLRVVTTPGAMVVVAAAIFRVAIPLHALLAELTIVRLLLSLLRVIVMVIGPREIEET